MIYEPDLIDNLISSVRGDYENRGNDSDSANAYTLGYIGAVLRDTVKMLPKSKRKEFEAEILRRIEWRSNGG